MEKKELKLVLAICFLTLIVRLIIAFTVPNFTYDSYFHLRQVEHIVDTGLPLYEDTLSYGGREFRFLPLFHYVMAFFGIFLPLEIMAKILPNILYSLLPFIIYLIAKKVSANSKGALLAALIAGFLPALFEPNSFTSDALFLPLVFYVLYAFLSIEEKGTIAYYLLAFVLLCFTSSLTALLLVGFIVYALLLYLEEKKLSQGELELMIFSLFFFLWSQLLFFKKIFVAEGLEFIWKNIPPTILQEFFPSPTLSEALIMVSLIPFMVGIYVVYRSLFQLKRKDTLILISMVIATTIMSWSRFIEFKLSLGFFGLILAILFASFYQEASAFIKRTKFASIDKVFFPLGLIILLLLTTILPAINIGLSQETPTNNEIEAFKWIEENTPASSGVFTLLEEGHLITFYSKRRNMMDSQFSLAPDVEGRLNDLGPLFRTPFQTQALEIFGKYNLNYLLFTQTAQQKTKTTKLKFITPDCFNQISVGDARIQLYEVRCLLK